MGRLTEVFDIVENGIQEPYRYTALDVTDKKTRDALKLMRAQQKRSSSREDADAMLW
jgi:hypothetical protein